MMSFRKLPVPRKNHKVEPPRKPAPKKHKKQTKRTSR
jgi:hypothetical protein